MRSPDGGGAGAMLGERGRMGERARLCMRRAKGEPKSAPETLDEKRLSSVGEGKSGTVLPTSARAAAGQQVGRREEAEGGEGGGEPGVRVPRARRRGAWGPGRAGWGRAQGVRTRSHAAGFGEGRSRGGEAAWASRGAARVGVGGVLCCPGPSLARLTWWGERAAFEGAIHRSLLIPFDLQEVLVDGEQIVLSKHADTI